MASAARLGLKVAKPHGDSARYDVVVEGGGKLHRVQVKSTTFKRNGCHQCLCYWRSKSPQSKHLAGNASVPSSKRVSRRYSNQQTDFVAAYVVPDDAWFIIPASEIRTISMHLPPREHPERNRYGQFKIEAWHLLGIKEEGLTIHAAAENQLVLQLIKLKIAQLCGMPHPSKRS